MATAVVVFLRHGFGSFAIVIVGCFIATADGKDGLVTDLRDANAFSRDIGAATLAGV
jgi:hypothetical protein